MNQDPDRKVDAIGSTPAPESNEEHTGEMNRRKQMLTAGALGIVALLGTMSGSAEAAKLKFGPELFDQDNLTNFANLTIAIWEDPDGLGQQYNSDPRTVLEQFGVQVPKGIATPLIPDPPEGGIDNIGQAWTDGTLYGESFLVKDVFAASKANYTTNTNGSIGTAGCPLGTFASFFCFK